MQWFKADATREQLEQDFSQCRQDAWREARLRSWHYPPTGPLTAQDAMGRRFVIWPNGPFGSFGSPLLEEGRLADFCMRSKGYQLVPVAPDKNP